MRIFVRLNCFVLRSDFWMFVTSGCLWHCFASSAFPAHTHTASQTKLMILCLNVFIASNALLNLLRYVLKNFFVFFVSLLLHPPKLCIRRLLIFCTGLKIALDPNSYKLLYSCLNSLLGTLDTLVIFTYVPLYLNSLPILLAYAWNSDCRLIVSRVLSLVVLLILLYSFN